MLNWVWNTMTTNVDNINLTMMRSSQAFNGDPLCRIVASKKPSHELPQKQQSKWRVLLQNYSFQKITFTRTSSTRKLKSKCERAYARGIKERTQIP